MNKKIKLIIEILIFIIIIGGITFIYYRGNNKENQEEAKRVGIIKITDDNFEEEVINSDKKIILEFTSNSCPPCISMLPVLINIAKNNEDVKVGTINIDESDSSKIVSDFRVSATPTIILLENNSVKEIFVGATSEEKIMNELRK